MSLVLSRTIDPDRNEIVIGAPDDEVKITLIKQVGRHTRVMIEAPGKPVRRGEIPYDEWIARKKSNESLTKGNSDGSSDQARRNS